MPLEQPSYGLSEFLEEHVSKKPINQLYIAIAGVMLILLCWVAVQVQYCHQRRYLQERLPAAHLKLFRGIMAQEAVNKYEIMRR